MECLCCKQHPIRHKIFFLSDIRSLKLSNFGEPKQNLLTSSSSKKLYKSYLFVGVGDWLSPPPPPPPPPPPTFMPMFNIAMKWLQMSRKPIPETKSAEHDYIAKNIRVTVAAEKCPILNMISNTEQITGASIDPTNIKNTHTFLC